MKRFQRYESRHAPAFIAGAVSLVLGTAITAGVMNRVNENDLDATRAAGVTAAEKAHKDGEQAANTQFCQKLGKAVMGDTKDTVYTLAWVSHESTRGMTVSKDAGVISLTYEGVSKTKSTVAPGDIYKNNYYSEVTLVLGADGLTYAKPQIKVSGGMSAETLSSDGSVENNGSGGVTTTLESDGSAASVEAVERIIHAASSGNPTEVADAFNGALSPRDAKFQSVPSMFSPAELSVGDTTSYRKYELGMCSADEKVRDGLSGIVMYGQPLSDYLDEALAAEPIDR